MTACAQEKPHEHTEATTKFSLQELKYAKGMTQQKIVPSLKGKQPNNSIFQRGESHRHFC